MAAQQRVGQRRTDWFRVLADLQYQGINNSDVARRIGVPASTLRQWKEGSEPAHRSGEALLLLWSETTGVAISNRPMAIF